MNNGRAYGIVHRDLDRMLKRIIADECGIRETELFEKTRVREIIFARKVYFKYICGSPLYVPMYRIQKELKPQGYVGFDHANILHNIKTLNNWIDTDEDVRNRWDRVKERLDKVREPFEENHSIMTDELINEILARTPLKTKLKVAFQMNDYENWKDGEYKGDADKYVEVAMSVFNDYNKLKEQL